ncbi:MAG: hypothetical protein IJ494_04770 [Bacteroides sp.]|nr:hypothetical protein [Bacteroides sp.]
MPCFHFVSRKVNGAQVKQIYWLFGKLYFKIYVAVAIPVSLLAMTLLTLWSQSETIFFDYKNPLYWITVLAVTALVVLFSVVGQIYQISRVNPAVVIKSD